jgi:hypothetical protein
MVGVAVCAFINPAETMRMIPANKIVFFIFEIFWFLSL